MKTTKDLYKWALQLAIPIMIQNLISTLVGTADTVMLGFVGQTAMSASSLANQYIFVLFCMFYGMATATSVMCAQYWGKGDRKTIERIIGLAARVAILFALVFTVVSFLFPEMIMRLFTSSVDTIEMGKQYLRVLSISFVFMAISQVYLSALRSIGKVAFPSAVAVISLCVNIFFNAAFIFGLFGLPRLGVTGVALGTVIARATEMVLCIVYSFRSDIRFRVKYIFAKTGALKNDFFKISVPSIGNDLVWSLATSVFAAIMGHMGDDIVAANAVAIMVVNIGAIAMRGFANSTTIVIGQTLGANHIEPAKVYARKLVRLTGYVGCVGCIVIVGLRPFIMSFYSNKLSEQAVAYLGSMMLMTTYRMIGEGINTCLICGCFRGGGDTKMLMFADNGFLWALSIPLGYAAGFIFHWNAFLVYVCLKIDQIVKTVWCIFRLKSGKWIKKIKIAGKDAE